MFVKGLSTVFINIDIFSSIEVPLAPKPFMLEPLLFPGLPTLPTYSELMNNVIRYALPDPREQWLDVLKGASVYFGGVVDVIIRESRTEEALQNAIQHLDAVLLGLQQTKQEIINWLDERYASS